MNFTRHINTINDSLPPAVPPYVPEVTGETDTSNFDEIDPNAKLPESQPPHSHAAFKGHHLPFAGWTFSNNRYDI